MDTNFDRRGPQSWSTALRLAACCSMFSVRNKVNLPHLDELKFSTMSGLEDNREYFEFEGGNVFSWSNKNCTEEQKENLYKMVTENVVSGNIVPKQILPLFYHNQILAEAIKGNRKSTVVKYLESVKHG